MHRCDTCDYYVAPMPGTVMGECRCYAPAGAFPWPPKVDGNGCGQHSDSEYEDGVDFQFDPEFGEVAS